METTRITCSFLNETALYQAYMPFLKNGGLFIKTPQLLSLGAPVVLTIHLLKEAEPVEIETKVVWLTPRGAQGSREPGLGLQFVGENAHYLSNKIETCLAGMLKSSQPTDTL